MELMSVASSKNEKEAEILELLGSHFHKLSRSETKKWLWNAVDDLLNRGEDVIDGNPHALPSIPPDWDIDLSDVVEYVETDNQYAIIYVLCHRLLFCNGEMNQASA